ncbi:hypothetical protein L596_001903 [Steinernema carpocapsae]|uniref:Uncharacterized protein n=1 Tax=Steinernema carpocapsae TaxID=34508 RepID=A0A4U8UMY2_STECR|nr:hypothetical protein L596_001903 [Steinernema carpocapsae]
MNYKTLRLFDSVMSSVERITELLNESMLKEAAFEEQMNNELDDIQKMLEAILNAERTQMIIEDRNRNESKGAKGKKKP